MSITITASTTIVALPVTLHPWVSSVWRIFWSPRGRFRCLGVNSEDLLRPLGHSESNGSQHQLQSEVILGTCVNSRDPMGKQSWLSESEIYASILWKASHRGTPEHSWDSDLSPSRLWVPHYRRLMCPRVTSESCWHCRIWLISTGTEVWSFPEAPN